MTYSITTIAMCVIVLATYTVKGAEKCSSKIDPAQTRKCPDGLRDDGLSCWRDSYGRGVGRIPDLLPCGHGQRDDGTSCWIDSYGRGVGRAADKSACPSGLRDDGTSCWSDAHIYGKGCCCTFWGCCRKCRRGYHDDGCTCRKTDVGIKMTLFQRHSCRADEEKYGFLCYPKCAKGYRPVGCCICEPHGGPRIVITLSNRQNCGSNEERNGLLCYPKCKEGYQPVGCCICQPEGGPGIKIHYKDRLYCTGDSKLFNGVCVDFSECERTEEIEQLKQVLSAKKAGD